MDNATTLDPNVRLPTWSLLTEDEEQIHIRSYQTQLANTNHDISVIDAAFAADDGYPDPRDTLIL